MGIINVLLIIITLLGAFLSIMLIVLKRRKTFSMQNCKTIKDYLKIYKEDVENCKMVEIDSQLKLEEISKFQISPILLILLIIIISYFFNFIMPKFPLIGFWLVFAFVIGSVIMYLITKKPTIKKIILKNNEIELYNSNEEVRVYPLDKINVRYNFKIFREHSALKSYKYINIFFNNDKYTSKEFTIYNFESYIAFVMFINLLKRNELEKINNLNNDEIERLQQEFKYRET